MDTREILEQVRLGQMSVNDAEAYFRRQPLEELGYAKLDTHRKLRSGFAEVVFCSGKADEHLCRIYERIYAAEGEVLGTRASAEQAALIQERFGEAQYDPLSRILKIEKKDKKRAGKIAVCTAGTADIPVTSRPAFPPGMNGPLCWRRVSRPSGSTRRITAWSISLWLLLNRSCCNAPARRPCRSPFPGSSGLTTVFWTTRPSPLTSPSFP